MAALAPSGIIRRPALGVAAAGENHITDFQVGHRAVVRQGAGIDLLGHAQGRLADLEGRAAIPDNCRIEFVAVDHHGEVAGFGGERVILRGEQRHRQHNERVIPGDQETTTGQIRHPALEKGDAFAQPFLAFRAGGPLRQFLFPLLDPALPTRDHRIDRRALFEPAVAGEWLVMRRVDYRLRHRRQPVAIRAVGHHIHFRLQEKHPPPVGGPQVEHRLAVVEVVFR